MARKEPNVPFPRHMLRVRSDIWSVSRGDTSTILPASERASSSDNHRDVLEDQPVHMEIGDIPENPGPIIADEQDYADNVGFGRWPIEEEEEERSVSDLSAGIDL